jgi:hypothetical protein
VPLKHAVIVAAGGQPRVDYFYEDCLLSMKLFKAAPEVLEPLQLKLVGMAEDRSTVLGLTQA